MRDDKIIRSEDVVQRDAATNAGLGIAAFVAARPYIDKVIDKVTEPKPESPVVIPPGTRRPSDD